MALAQPSQDKNGDAGSGSGSGNPIFHDFFVSHSPLLQTQIKLPQPSASSATHTGNHFLSVPMHAQNSHFLASEATDRFLGRKRNNPETMPPDSLESSQLMKMLRSTSSRGDHPRRFHHDELSFGMQPPKSNSTSNLILQPHMSGRSESVASEWESSMINVGPSTQYSSRLAHFATYLDKASTRDIHAAPSILSPSAADEGSRTGIKGSGVLSAINATPDVLIRSHRPSSGLQSSDHESFDSLRQPGSDSAFRQMTIFYAGQAHVFDQVHPNKADVIMSLAGSDGGSWSTTYSPKSSARVHHETHIPNREKQQRVGNAAPSHDLHGKLSNIPGSSIHGIQISTTTGSSTLRPARSFNQHALPKIDGRRHVE